MCFRSDQRWLSLRGTAVPAALKDQGWWTGREEDDAIPPGLVRDSLWGDPPKMHRITCIILKYFKPTEVEEPYRLSQLGTPVRSYKVT